MQMFILENVPLNAYSTMRLGGPAAYLTDINNRFEVAEAVQWAAERKLPVIMIGIGSNIIWGDDGYPGLVLVNKIQRFETFQEDNENLYLTVGAGENWDSVVERVVNMGYSGIEELSLIPGTAGATPIQNVGAYGREIKDVLTTVEAFDTQVGKLVTIPAADCEFGYRMSRFKSTDKGRFFITAITLHVVRRQPQPPFYESLSKYFAEHNITTFTPQIVRDAVINIRRNKLPDPAVTANNGSFFFNPTISRDELNALLSDYPTLVYWPRDDGSVKVSAAWLVEQAGFKDFHDPETGMATWYKHSLVLVNEKAERTTALLTFRQKIIDTVAAKFGITLQQEPEIIP
jgi:UDP-N-acetylmuramate dehydrogenase